MTDPSPPAPGITEVDDETDFGPPVDPDKVCGGCGLELTDEELKGTTCPRCKQVWPTPERL